MKIPFEKQFAGVSGAPLQEAASANQNFSQAGGSRMTKMPRFRDKMEHKVHPFPHRLEVCRRCCWYLAYVPAGSGLTTGGGDTRSVAGGGDTASATISVSGKASKRKSLSAPHPREGAMAIMPSVL